MRISKNITLLFLFLSIILMKPIPSFCNPNQETTLVLNNPIDSGLGAILSSVFTTLYLYDYQGFGGVKIDLNSGIYLDPELGPNYWEYFFEPIDLGEKTNTQHVFTFDEVSALVNAGFQLPRESVFASIQKHVHLKPELNNEIEQIVRNQFKDYFIIGVHHRGTDKILEAPIVPWNNIVNHVNEWIKKCPIKNKVRIFIATDDQHFLNHMLTLFPKQIIYNDFVRSKDQNPLHYGNGYANNYQKGKEALMDCLLLSKCHVLIFPAASAFSMAALKFNPFLVGIPLAG